MKKKNEGFTLIELVLGLSLIVLIILPVFGVVTANKNKELIESNKTDLTIFKNKILTTIETDIVKKGIKYTCEYAQKETIANYVNIDTKQRLMYRDGTYADVTIDTEVKTVIYTTYDSQDQKQNETTFVLPVADAKIEDTSYIQGGNGRGTGNVNYNYFYIFSPNINLKNLLNPNQKNTILKIFIPITYEGVDYSIAITSTFTYEEDENSSCGVDDENGKYCPYSDKEGYTYKDGVFTCTNNFLK